MSICYYVRAPLKFVVPTLCENIYFSDTPFVELILGGPFIRGSSIIITKLFNLSCALYTRHKKLYGHEL